jgi:hypothetical protein
MLQYIDKFRFCVKILCLNGLNCPVKVGPQSEFPEIAMTRVATIKSGESLIKSYSTGGTRRFRYISRSLHVMSRGFATWARGFATWTRGFATS